MFSGCWRWITAALRITWLAAFFFSQPTHWLVHKKNPCVFELFLLFLQTVWIIQSLVQTSDTNMVSEGSIWLQDIWLLLFAGCGIWVLVGRTQGQGMLAEYPVLLSLLVSVHSSEILVQQSMISHSTRQVSLLHLWSLCQSVEMHRNCCACLMTTMDSATQGSLKNTKNLSHREWYLFLFSLSCEMLGCFFCFRLKFGWNKLLWHITHSSSCACFPWFSPSAILLALSLKPSFNQGV